MKAILCLALLATALCGCLGLESGKTISDGVVLATQPTPMEGDMEETFLYMNVTLINNNPFAIRVQCFPPEGPGSTYADYLQRNGSLNNTLLARPEISCEDPDVNLSKGGYVYPVIKIKPGSNHTLVMKVSRMIYVQVRNGTQIPSTMPGTYDLEMRFDVACEGLVAGCMNTHEDIRAPIKVNVLPQGGGEGK